MSSKTDAPLSALGGRHSGLDRLRPLRVTSGDDTDVGKKRLGLFEDWKAVQF